jgi:hypothetical protein
LLAAWLPQGTLLPKAKTPALHFSLVLRVVQAQLVALLVHVHLLVSMHQFWVFLRQMRSAQWLLG